MKDFFKIIINVTIVILIGAIGVWGVITNESDTELGWQIWGWLLALIIIGIPTARFWTKQVAKVIDLDV